MSRFEWMIVALALTFVIGARRAYAVPPAAEPYLDLFRAAEQRYNLPENLLVRVAHAESSFRPDAMSAAGAVGIMQIVPRWHPDVNPLDPAASIDYAGAYLRRLYDRFQSWHGALAAYNWGQGNVDEKGLHAAPPETRNYVAKITGDLGLI